MGTPVSGVDGVRLTPRLNTVVFLAALLATVGLGTITTSTLSVAVILGVLVFLQSRHATRCLSGFAVERAHLPRTYENAEVQVELRIHNPHPRARTLVHITDSFPPSGAYRVRMLAARIAGESRALFRYHQRCSRKRGFYTLGPVVLSAADELGLCEITRTSDELTDMIVYPVPAHLHRLPIVGRPARVNIGEEIVRARGRSEQFASLREYAAGDPMRLVHWRSTARLGYPVIKEFDKNVVVEVTVFIDLRLVSLVGIGESNSVERRIEAAAAVAAQAIDRHHLVRLVGVCEPGSWTGLGGGTRHLTTLLDWLALAGTRGGGSFESHVERAMHWCPPGSTTVLLVGTTGLDLDRLPDTIRMLVFRRVLPFVVIIEDREYEKIRDEHIESFSAAPEMAHLVHALTAAGAIVYTVGRHDMIRDRMAVPA